MVKKASQSTPAKAAAAAAARRKKSAAIFEEEEKILRQAAIYCLRTFPMLWTVGGIKEEQGDNGSRRWIIAVYLRYPIGHEGYLGDLLYDGKTITELTDRAVMRQRAKVIAAAPERMRQWNKYRASTLPPGIGRFQHAHRLLGSHCVICHQG
jgi:hypothetical protein